MIGRPAGTMWVPSRSAILSSHPGDGRSKLIRRLYAEERCSVEEVAAWTNLRAWEVAKALRYMPIVAPGVNL